MPYHLSHFESCCFLFSVFLHPLQQSAQHHHPTQFWSHSLRANIHQHSHHRKQSFFHIAFLHFCSILPFCPCLALSTHAGLDTDHQQPASHHHLSQQHHNSHPLPCSSLQLSLRLPLLSSWASPKLRSYVSPHSLLHCWSPISLCPLPLCVLSFDLKAQLCSC